MMVSATYIVSQSMRVDLPNTETSDGSAASLAAVTIGADGAMQFNGEAVDEPALVRQLQEARARDEDLTLIVSADRAAALPTREEEAEAKLRSPAGEAASRAS